MKPIFPPMYFDIPTEEVIHKILLQYVLVKLCFHSSMHDDELMS